MGRVAIRRPAQPLLGIANRFAGIGPDNAICITRIMPAAVQQTLVLEQDLFRA